MEYQIYLTELYDYYKKLLTEKQQNYFEDYYFENLTMDEIAENNNISKNAVSKTLMDIKEKLINYEDSLQLWHNHQSIKNVVSDEVYEKIKDFI